MSIGKLLSRKSYKWNNWSDVIDPVEKASVWAEYNDQFYKGKASVTSVKHGKGTVTFIGTDTDDGELEKDMLRKVYEQAGIGIEDLPEGMVMLWRHGFWIGMNYSSETREINIPDNAKIIIGQKILKPAEVVVWK